MRDFQLLQQFRRWRGWMGSNAYLFTDRPDLLLARAMFIKWTAYALADHCRSVDHAE